MQTDLIAHLTLAAPEVLLAVGALALLMIGVFSGERATTLVNGLSVAVLIAALALVVLFPTNGAAFGGAIVNDSFSRFMKVLTLIGSIVTLITLNGHVSAACRRVTDPSDQGRQRGFASQYPQCRAADDDIRLHPVARHLGRVR